MKFVKTFNAKEQHIKVDFVAIENDLDMLTNNFKKYLMTDDNLIARYEWVRDPVQNTRDGLPIAQEEMFIGIYGA